MLRHFFRVGLTHSLGICQYVTTGSGDFWTKAQTQSGSKLNSLFVGEKSDDWGKGGGRHGD